MSPVAAAAQFEKDAPGFGLQVERIQATLPGVGEHVDMPLDQGQDPDKLWQEEEEVEEDMQFGSGEKEGDLEGVAAEVELGIDMGQGKLLYVSQPMKGAAKELAEGGQQQQQQQAAGEGGRGGGRGGLGAGRGAGGRGGGGGRFNGARGRREGRHGGHGRGRGMGGGLNGGVENAKAGDSSCSVSIMGGSSSGVTDW